MTVPTFTQAIRLTDLAENTKVAIDIHGKSILICNSGQKIFAVSNICSHADEKLECGKMSNGWIACPVHGARFDLATGKAKNAPAKRPIETFPVRVIDDWIEVEI